MVEPADLWQGDHLAVFTAVGAAAMGGGGAMDVEIGTIKMLHRGGADTVDDRDLAFSDPVFDYTGDGGLQAGTVGVFYAPLSLGATAGGGTLEGGYSLERAVVINGNTTTVTIRYDLSIDDYTSQTLVSYAAGGADVTDGYENSLLLYLRNVVLRLEPFHKEQRAWQL